MTEQTTPLAGKWSHALKLPAPEDQDDSAPSPSGLKKLTKHLRLVVSAALLGVLAWRTNWDQLGQAFAHLHLGFWLGAFGLYIVSQVISGFRWKMLAHPLGFEGSVRKFIGLYFIGMFFNLILPTSVGGDVVRAWYLDAGSGRRMAALLCVLVDRVSGLLILLLVACVAVLACPFALPAWVKWSVWGMTGGIAAGLFTLPLLARCFASFARLAALHEGARSFLRYPRLLIVTSMLSFGVQAANVFMVWMIGLAIAAPVPAAYYWVLVPMVSLLTLLPISLNGMGVREGTTALFLAPLGIGQDAAFCLALLWFSVLTAAGLCGGVVYFLSHYPRPRGEANHELIGGDPHQGRAGQPRTAA